MFEDLIVGKIQSKPGSENLPEKVKEDRRKAWEKIGISLHPDKWKSSPSYAYFAKIFLNSFIFLSLQTQFLYLSI